MKTTFLKSLLIGALLQSAIPVQSQPAVYFGQPTLSGGFDGDDQMQGFEFIPGLDVTAVKLGLYDGRSSGGSNSPIK